MKREEKIGYISGILSTSIMGFSFYFSKLALNQLNNKVLDLLSYRFLMSVLGIAFLWIFKFIKLDFKGKNIKALLAMCIMQPVAYFIAETIGLSMTATSEAGLIMALLPIVIIVMGVLILGERVSLKQIIFITVSIGGAIFINVMGYVPQNSSNIGRIILLLAVVLGGIYSIFMRKLSEEFTPMERTAAMMMMGALVFSLMAGAENIYRGTFNQYIAGMFNIKLLLPLMFLGLGSSLLAMYLLNISYTYLEATKVSIVTNLITVVSIFAGVILLNENFFWYHVLGTILILVGAVGSALEQNPEELRDDQAVQEEVI